MTKGDEVKVEVLPGVEATGQEIRACLDGISGSRLRLFWAIVESLRDQAHLNASKPAGSLYATGKMSGSRMIPMDVLNAQRGENLAKENAFDEVCSVRDLLKNVLTDPRFSQD